MIVNAKQLPMFNPNEVKLRKTGTMEIFGSIAKSESGATGELGGNGALTSNLKQNGGNMDSPREKGVGGGGEHSEERMQANEADVKSSKEEKRKNDKEEERRKNKEEKLNKKEAKKKEREQAKQKKKESKLAKKQNKTNKKKGNQESELKVKLLIVDGY